MGHGRVVRTLDLSVASEHLNDFSTYSGNFLRVPLELKYLSAQKAAHKHTEIIVNQQAIQLIKTCGLLAIWSIFYWHKIAKSCLDMQREWNL